MPHKTQKKTSLVTQRPTNSFQCSACPVATFYRPEENRCKPCQPNSRSYQVGSVSCMCNAGYKQNGSMNSLYCEACPAGYTSAVAAVACTICPAGYYSPEKGSGSCLICDAGSISPSNGSAFCAPCPPGYYSPIAGATACRSAPPGYFSSQAGSTGYQICDQGTYSAAPSQAGCQPCAPGTVTATFGSISESDCVSPMTNFIAVRYALLVAF